MAGRRQGRLLVSAVVLLGLVGVQLILSHARLGGSLASLARRRRAQQQRGSSAGAPLPDPAAAPNATAPTPSTFVGEFPSDGASLLPLCGAKQLRHGAWQPRTLPAPPYVSRTMHLRCQNRTVENYYHNHSYETYQWVPADGGCRFLDFSADRFCDLMKYTTVSIVGDSLSWEHYSSLLQLLGKRVRQSDQHRSKTLRANHVQVACGRGTTKVVFRNDPRLEQVADAIRQDFPIALVLNRGAHYVPDAELLEGIRGILPALRQWRAACRRMGIPCHLYWRTTVPGHPNCVTATEPDNDLERMRALTQDRSNYDNVTAQYHWYDFERQNGLVVDLLRSPAVAADLSVTVLPAYELNLRRPDGHRAQDGDCLHNCYPGKMDVYSQLLLHLLARERPPKVVEDYQRRFREAYERYQLRQQEGAGQDAQARIQQPGTNGTVQTG